MQKSRVFLYSLVVSIIGFAIFVASQIPFETDPNPYALIPESDRSKLETFEDAFKGNGDPMMIIVLEKNSGWKTYEDFQFLDEATRWWKFKDSVVAVSITNVPFPVQTLIHVKTRPFVDLQSKKKFDKWKKRSDKFGDITSKFLSANNKYALVFVPSKDFSKEKANTFKSKFRKNGVNPIPLDYSEIETELQSANQSETILLTAISLAVILLLFFVLTGSLKGLFFIFMMITFSLSLTTIFIYSAGIWFTVHMVAIPCMIVVLSFTDLMHLLYTHHTIRKEVDSDKELRRSLSKSLHRPMVLTSLSNMVGFILFLILANNETLRDISLFSIVGVLFAFLVSRYMAIQLLTSKDQFFSEKTGHKWEAFHSKSLSLLNPKKKILLIASVLLTFVLGSIIYQNATINNVPFVTEGKSDSFKAARIIGTHFFGDKTASIHFEFDSKSKFWCEDGMNYVQKVENAVDSLFDPIMISSPTIIAKRYHRFQRNGHPGAFTLPIEYDSTFHHNTKRLGGSSIISSKANKSRIQFSFPDMKLEVSLLKMEKLKRYLNSNPPPNGIRTELSGRDFHNDHATYNFSVSIVYGLLLSVVFGAIVTFIFIRNATVFLVTLIANTLPLFVSLIVMQLSGSELNPISLFFFTVIMGLCVDDSIYLILHRETKTKGSIYPIAITSAVLAVGFSTFLFSSYDWIRPFGWIFISGILTAFLFDAFLLALFTNRNSTFDTDV